MDQSRYLLDGSACSSSACIVHLLPPAGAMRAIPEDNSKLGRESPLDLATPTTATRSCIFGSHRQTWFPWISKSNASLSASTRLVRSCASRDAHARKSYRENREAWIAHYARPRCSLENSGAWSKLDECRLLSAIAESREKLAACAETNRPAGWREWKSRENSCSLLLR